MRSAAWRVPVFAAIVGAFFLQGALVWSDWGPRPGSTIEISPLARVGQRIFRERNCQACHQLYGMGGFLGPDLTNAAQRVPPGRFAEILRDGTRSMPAFRLDEFSQRALFAYLEAVDATGQGTPPAPPGEFGALFDAALERWRAAGKPVPEEVRRGAEEAMRRGCGGCHRSFAARGALRAPDLSLAVAHLGREGVLRVLRDGRGAMPKMDLTDSERESLVALLSWVGERRDELSPGPPRTWREVSWWAYEASGPETAGQEANTEDR